MRKTQRPLALLLALALLVPCFGVALAEDGDDPAEVGYFYKHGNVIYYRAKRPDGQGGDKDVLDESADFFYLDLMGNEQYKSYLDDDAPHDTTPLYENSIAEYWASVAEYINLSTELGNITNFDPILSVLERTTLDRFTKAGQDRYDNEQYTGFSTRPTYALSMNAARDKLIEQFNRKWSGRKLQDLSGAFSYPDSSLAGNKQPVVATAVHIEDDDSDKYSGAVVYFTDFKVVALLPNAGEKTNYVQTIEGDDASGEPTYTYGITNQTMVPVTASQNVSNSWSTTVSSEISHTEEYSFSEGISIGTSLDFGFASMSVDVDISATQAVSDSWKDGRSQEKSSSVSRSVTVALPAYTSVLLKQTNGTQTITTKYNCPIGLRFTARIVGYGKYGSDAQMKRHFWMFGTDARADLYRRAIVNGDLDAEVSSQYSEAVRWSAVKRVRGDYGQDTYDPFYTDYGVIQVAARFVPFGKTGAKFIQTLKSMNTDVMGVVPLEPLDYIKLEAPNVFFISDQPVSYGNFNYLHADMKVGDSSFTSLLTLSGKNSFGADYYGFNPLNGHWEVVDESGTPLTGNDAPVKLEKLDGVSKNMRYIARNPGKCFLKYFIDDNTYPVSTTSLDEGYLVTDQLSMTAALEITVVEDEVEPTHTIEVTGSYTGEKDKAAEKLEDHGLEVSICGEDGKEIAENYTWEARELPAKGIQLESNGTVSFTKAGTFHVRAVCETHNIASDWVEITAIERKPAAVTTAPKARSLTYSGEDQQLVTPGEAEGGTMVYWLDEDNSDTLPEGAAFTADIPEAKEAGDYTVWYKARGDKTHTDSQPGKVAVTIRQAPAEPVQPNPDALVYNGKAQTLVVAGTVEGGTLQYRVGGESEWSEDIPARTDAGDYTVWYMVKGDSNHKDSDPASLKVTIEKKPLVVTADDAEKTYGAADPSLTWTADGLVGSDGLTGKLKRAQGEDVGTYAIRQGTLTAGNNYALYFNEGLFGIKPKAITVKAKDVSVVYGDADPALKYTVTGLVGQDQLTGQLSRREGGNVGTYRITQGTLAATGNYNLTFKDAVFTITRRPLTVKARSRSKVYGNADPQLDYTASGLVGQDQLTGRLSRGKGENVGTYRITQGTLAATDNYKLTFKDAAFTIIRRPLIVKALNQSKVYGNADAELKYIATGLAGQDQLTGQLSREEGENAGTYRITQGTLAATDNYKLTFKDAAFTIIRRPLTVRARNKSKAYGAADPVLDYTASGLVGKDKLTGKLSRDPGEEPGKYAIKQGSLAASGNYKLTFRGAQLTIGKKPAPPKPFRPVAPDYTLLAKMETYGNNQLKLTWTKVEGAQGYDVFFKRCDGDADLPQVRSLTKTSCIIKNLARSTCYKAYVQAWRKKGNQKTYIGDMSPMVHCIVNGYGRTKTNAKSVKLNRSALVLTVGRVFTLKTTVTGEKSGRELVSHERAVRYYSSNANVAKVNSLGKVTAVAKGSCTIYALANNGVQASVQIKVTE